MIQTFSMGCHHGHRPALPSGGDLSRHNGHRGGDWNCSYLPQRMTEYKFSWLSHINTQWKQCRLHIVSKINSQQQLEILDPKMDHHTGARGYDDYWWSSQKGLWRHMGVMVESVSMSWHNCVMICCTTLRFPVQCLSIGLSVCSMIQRTKLLSHFTLDFVHSRRKVAFPDSKVHGANMAPIWGRQDTGGPHVGPTNFAIWVKSWWLHDMETLSASVVICENNPLVISEALLFPLLLTYIRYWINCRWFGTPL